MNQARRLAYLRAMGIDSYVRRELMAAPGHATESASEPDLSPEPQQPVGSAVTTAAAVKVENRPSPASELREALSGRQPPAPVGSAGDPPDNRGEVSPELTHAPGDSGMVGPLRFSLRFMPINDRLSVIDEIPFADNERREGRTNELLQAILRALGIETPSPLSAQRFNWPLTRGDEGTATQVEEAYQALTGFLRRQLAGDNCRVLLVFAGQLEKVFNAAGIDALLAAADTRVIHVDSLAALLQVPGMKRRVWEAVRGIPDLLNR